jgi:phage-related protein
LADLKELYWVGSSLDDLRKFPQAVRQEAGYALYLAQEGAKHPNAKPLKGFSGAGTLEVVVDEKGDTYRAVYTVSFRDVVYVLHAFQKKSKRGTATPKREVQQIRNRLKQAKVHYAGIRGRKHD